MGAFLTCAVPAAPTWAQPLPVERIIPKINNLSLPLVSPNEAEKLAMPAKSIVLHLREVTLAQALGELQKQSGVALNFDWSEPATLDKKLSLDLETRFFQPAFDAIMDEAGVKGTLQRDGHRKEWRVQFGPDSEKISGPQSGVGTFQAQLQSVDSNFRETVKPNANGQAVRSQERSFSISIDGRTDPILDVIGTPLIILKRVEDDKRRSLLDANGNQWLRYDFDSGWYGVRSQSFNTPASDAKSLARIEGTAIYVVPTEREQWEIADVLASKNATHQFDVNGRQVTFKIKSVERDGNTVNLKYEMSMTTDTGADAGEVANPLFSFGQMRRVIRLEDANGNIFGVGGSGGGSNGGNKIEMRSEFSLMGNQRFTDGGEPIPPPAIVEPIKLIFDGPVEFVQTEVPFSFENVPLP